MRLPRPYIPLGVRLVVASRQAGFAVYSAEVYSTIRKKALLDELLRHLFGDKPAQLDHDPALENRTLVLSRLSGSYRYYPDANDPDYLIYREKHAHYIKTNVRGDGAQYPDRVIAKRERKRLKKRKPKWKPRKVKYVKKPSTAGS